MSRKGATRALAALALVIGALGATSAPAGAQGTSFNCDASALRVTLLGQATVEPVTANRGAGQCANASNSLALPAPLASTVANALTQVTPDNQNAKAIGGVGGLAVSPGALTPVLAALQSAVAAAQAGAQPAIDAIAPITVPLAQPPIPIAGLPTSVTVDIRPALDALLQAIGSTNADLVDLNLATAYANAQCVANQPQLSGSSQLGALKVLGLTIPTDTATTQALNVINTQSIDPSKIDLSKIVIVSPSSPLSPSVLSLVQSALTPLLANIPPISIPAQLAQIALTPNQQTRTASTLTEDALHLTVSLLGQNLIDAGLGEARVSNSSVNCAPQSPVTQAALQCATRKLTLINVVQHGGHVALLGAADRSLIGQRVAIYYLVGHKLVATPVVGANGIFTARAPLPPARQRFTNLARYQAVDQAGERSLDLKLHRRMVVDETRVAGGNVSITGRVLGPLTKPVAPILIQRRVSCTQLVTVARLRPNPRTGAFKVTLPAPPNTQAAVYRAATQVLKVDTNPKQFPTFTLPNFVALP